jgi:spore germination protein KC
LQFGVDAAKDGDNLEVSFEFAQLSSFSENSSSQDSKPIINTVSTPSISTAINLMNAYVGKQLNLSHCKVVIFSEEIAKKGILPEVAELMNNTQVRPTVNVIVSLGDAKDYIENSVSSLEQVLTKYYDIFPTTSEYTGYTSNILLGPLYEDLISKDHGAVTILGKKSKSAKQQESTSGESSSSAGGMDSSDSSGNSSNSQESGSNEASDSSTTDKTSIEDLLPNESIIEGDRGTENIGLCVFKDDIYVGNLSAMETLCYSLIKNEVDNFLISIDNPSNPTKKIDLSVDSRSLSKIDIDLSKENPVINIQLHLGAKVLTEHEDFDYNNAETLSTLNNSLRDYISSQMKSYLYKTSKEYKCDINGFHKFIKKSFLTMSDFKNYNWEQKYQNAEFNIKINSNVISSLLIQNSH